MPIYEYECKACGHQLEAFQKMSDDALIECPQCHKPDLTKLVSAAGFQLKGTGWYATDFKDKGKEPKVIKKSTTSSDSGTSKDDKSSSSGSTTDGNA
jgi:putative FmdB family regulatory protein